MMQLNPCLAEIKLLYSFYLNHYNNYYNDLDEVNQSLSDLNYNLDGVKIYSIEDIDGFYYNPNKLGIGYLIQDNNAYLEFDISWIHLQLRIINNGFGFEWRAKHGDIAWHDWSTM